MEIDGIKLRFQSVATLHTNRREAFGLFFATSAILNHFMHSSHEYFLVQIYGPRGGKTLEIKFYSLAGLATLF